MSTVGGPSVTTLIFPMGSVNPFGFWLNVVPADGVFDVTTITAFGFSITRPDSTTAVWTPTILAGGSTTSVFISYQFAAGGADLAQLGPYYVQVSAAVAGGSIPCDAFRVIAVQPNIWTGGVLGSTTVPIIRAHGFSPTTPTVTG